MKTNLLSRRQFSRKMLLTAGVLGAAPAFLRGQNLNNKLNIAIIGSGGRGAGNLGGSGLREHCSAMRRQR